MAAAYHAPQAFTPISPRPYNQQQARGPPVPWFARLSMAGTARIPRAGRLDTERIGEGPMCNATRHSPDGRRLIVRGGLLLVLLALGCPGPGPTNPPPRASSSPSPTASPAAPPQGQGSTDRYVERFKGGPPREMKIVYDFNPDNKPAGHAATSAPATTWPCSSSAQQNVHTIAFVHADTTRHTVLPVLACRDIIMSPEARPGRRAARRQEPQEPLVGHVLEAYRDRRQGPPLPGRRPEDARPRHGGGPGHPRQGRAIGTSTSAAPPRRRRTASSSLKDEPDRPPGPSTTLYTQKDGPAVRPGGRRQGEPEEVARGLRHGAGQPARRPAHGPQPRRLAHRGATERSPTGLAESLKRQVGRAIGQQGQPDYPEAGVRRRRHPRRAATWPPGCAIRKDDKGENPIMTVAYVDHNAPDTAAFLALGCTEIVMQKDARFGDFSAVITEKRNGTTVNVDPSQYRAVREISLEALAQQPGLSAAGGPRR